ncbi:PREDICTED: protein AKNAD1 [Tauraco erythrolophus]|uniref:protein AKNAD1 n=1 Tax=Tauraco erythrolophus TaxID=121530 RepID=UPI0005239C50|nr:PREDICTED: protein AKNAD1 [Tauraco erythrolophus]
METTKKCKLSEWMKTQMNSSFSDELGCATDATDEEQDDLPYDGDVEITCKYNNNTDNLNDCTCTKDVFGILCCTEDNKNIKATANYETHLQPEEFSNHHRGAKGTTGISVETPGSEASFKKESPVGGFSKPESKEHVTRSKMSNVFLRHFSKGELISTCQLIECETIPETSFTESIDDAVSTPEPSEHGKGPLAQEQPATNCQECTLEKHEEVNTGDKSQNSLNENRCASNKSVSSTGKCSCRQGNSQLISENEDTHVSQNMKKDRDLLKERDSPHKLRYGQGQAHYCVCDFPEVASEVKIPKRSDNINSVPTIERTKPFPILLSQSLIVNKILENKNYFNSAEVQNQEERSIPELVQQLEMLPQSDFPKASIAIYSGGLQCGTTASALPAAGTVEAHCLNPSNLLPEPTLGEKMSQILKDQTDQLIKKVEDFSMRKTQETCLLQDNYPALNQLKRHLDALERNYLATREEHHNLQLQNYKNKSINIGEFDPERKVEGEIFRLGMLLEDIQEQTDDSKSNSSSLLTSYESAHSSYSLCEGLHTDALEDTEINLNSGITKNLFSLVPYVEIKVLVHPVTSMTPAYAQKVISTQKAQKSKRLHELVNRLSERQNFEAAKPCYSSTHDKITLSHQYLPSKKSARSKSAINIRNTNANDSNANILSSTLDHAIQTANGLKKATERMVRAVSEDLAKIKRKQL